MLAPASGAREYFVSPAGSDTQAGTLEAPFKTLKAAAERLQPGDICWLRAGTYRETLRPARSGLAGSPITFAGYQKEVVVLSGADPVGGWSIHQGKIEKAAMGWTLGSGLDQVLAEDSMLFEARFPNGTRTPMKPVLQDMNATATGVITATALDQPADFWVGGSFHGWMGKAWTAQGGKITASSPGRINVGGMTSPWFEGSGKAYVTGVLGALDSEGEWFHKDNTLFLWPPAGATAASLRIEAKRRFFTVDLRGLAYIMVKNVRTMAGTVRMDGNNCALEGIRGTYLSHYLHSGGSYQPDTRAEEGYNGILVGGTGNEVRLSHFAFSAGSGLVMLGSQNRVVDCIIRDADYQGLYSCPLAINGSSQTVEWNTLYNGGRDIMQIRGKKHVIRHNDMFNPGMLAHDKGVIYAYQVDGAGTDISYNWIHDSPLPGPNPCLYLDNYSTNFLVHHNVIWNCPENSGIRVNGPSSGHKLYNNTIFLADTIGSRTFSKEPSQPTTYTKINNLEFRNGPPQELTDPGDRDFRPMPGSKAVDMGKPIAGITDGFSGSAPDLGAYEAGGLAWKAGARGDGETSLVIHPVFSRLHRKPELAVLRGSLIFAPVGAARLLDSRGKALPLSVAGVGLYRVQGGLPAGRYWLDAPKGAIPLSNTLFP